MDEQYTEKEKAKRWLKLVVAPTIFPVAVSYMYDAIIGFNFVQILSRHILELILVIFALAVSIFGTAMDLDKKISNKTKENYAINSAGCGLLCIVAYCCLYERQFNISFWILLLIYVGLIIISYWAIINGYRLASEENKQEKLNLGNNIISESKLNNEKSN